MLNNKYDYNIKYSFPNEHIRLLTPESEFRKNCIYMLTLLPKMVQTKQLKLFLLKIFSICHRCQQHRWCTLSCEYLDKNLVALSL